jgi:hypothetical protein
MLTRSRNAVRSAAVGAGAALLVAVGCGQDGPKTYPVNGKVVYKGAGDVAKLEGGRVHLESVSSEPKVTASGDIEADGSFSVWCYLESKDREGVPAGEYRVCVRPARGGDEPRRGGPIHPRYQRFETSELKITVTPGTNTPTIEIEAGR